MLDGELVEVELEELVDVVEDEAPSVREEVTAAVTLPVCEGEGV